MAPTSARGTYALWDRASRTDFQRCSAARSAGPTATLLIKAAARWTTPGGRCETHHHRGDRGCRATGDSADPPHRRPPRTSRSRV